MTPSHPPRQKIGPLSSLPRGFFLLHPAYRPQMAEIDSPQNRTHTIR